MSETLADRLQADLTAAMKARDEVTTATLRMVRTALKNATVAGEQAVELTDDETIAVLRSEAKKRAEAAAIYEDAGRTESAARERAELAVVERYLPAAMADDELEALVDAAIAEAAARGVIGGAAIGAVIGEVRRRAGGTVDGGRVAALVKGRLAG